MFVLKVHYLFLNLFCYSLKFLNQIIEGSINGKDYYFKRWSYLYYFIVIIIIINRDYLVFINFVLFRNDRHFDFKNYLNHWTIFLKNEAVHLNRYLNYCLNKTFFFLGLFYCYYISRAYMFNGEFLLREYYC